MTPVPAIVVHGGAGSVDDDRVAAAIAGCAAAARAGLAVLAGGGRALDAAQAAVCVLEDDPEFNAGVGAALTRDGTVETDAAIMDGETLRIGAIGAVPGLRRPVDLARAVLDDGEHVLLVGPAAWDFAGERGMTPVPQEELVTERARGHLLAERAARAAGTTVRSSGGGTVGACAVDRLGHVAAATSTGGITFKRRGRVGDTPLCGCGTYADDLGGAASATGHGESIIRVNLTRYLVDRMRDGHLAQSAAESAIAELAARVRGAGGVICIDRRGAVGLAHNTPRMPAAHASLASPTPVARVEWSHFPSA